MNKTKQIRLPKTTSTIEIAVRDNLFTLEEWKVDLNSPNKVESTDDYYPNDLESTVYILKHVYDKYYI